MSKPATINPRIVEALNLEALSLSDEVRGAFTLSGRLERAGTEEDFARIAMSSEGLRTTTRMMHAIAWLLNHRAYFLGEISEFQLRHHGRLAPEMRRSDMQHLTQLDPPIRALVETTRSFYDRLLRLDQIWQAETAQSISAIQRLRERLEQRLAG